MPSCAPAVQRWVAWPVEASHEGALQERCRLRRSVGNLGSCGVGNRRGIRRRARSRHAALLGLRRRGVARRLGGGGVRLGGRHPRRGGRGRRRALREGGGVKFPARFIASNLIWSREGTCWAVWRVTPTSYPYLSATEKLQLHAQTRSALLMLPPESMILSLCHRLDPSEVVESMIAGVDLGVHPTWRAYASQTLDSLAGTAPFNRVHFLAVELPTEGAKLTMRAGFAAARVNIAEAFGLPPTPVYEAEVTERRRQAEHLRGQLQNVLRLRDATPGEIRWIYARAPLRGISDPALDESWEPNTRLIGEGESAHL